MRSTPAFRDHTCSLFARHGIGVAGFWINRADPNQLIYICTFEDAAQMERAWAAFRDDPEWQKARAESERDGSLVSFPRKRGHGPDRLLRDGRERRSGVCGRYPRTGRAGRKTRFEMFDAGTPFVTHGRGSRTCDREGVGAAVAAIAGSRDRNEDRTAMKFSFSEEQTEFRNMLRRFLQDRSPTTEVRRGHGNRDRLRSRGLADDGGRAGRHRNPYPRGLWRGRVRHFGTRDRRRGSRPRPSAVALFRLYRHGRDRHCRGGHRRPEAGPPAWHCKRRDDCGARCRRTRNRMERRRFRRDRPAGPATAGG